MCQFSDVSGLSSPPCHLVVLSRRLRVKVTAQLQESVAPEEGDRVVTKPFKNVIITGYDCSRWIFSFKQFNLN